MLLFSTAFNLFLYGRGSQTCRPIAYTPQVKMLHEQLHVPLHPNKFKYKDLT
jgi:hypothetical protein